MRFALILLIFLSFLAFSYEANDKDKIYCQSNRNLCNKRCSNLNASTRRRCVQKCNEEYFNCLKGIF